MTQEQKTPQPRIQVQIPQLPKEEVQRIAGLWRYKGLVITLDDPAIQFAMELSNDFVKNVVTQMIQQIFPPQEEKKSLVEEYAIY